MPLPATLFKRIQEVMLDAFSRDELHTLVDFGLGQDFEALTPDKDKTAQVSALLTWARRTGRLLDLMRCVHEERPDRPEVRALWGELSGRPAEDFAPQAAEACWRVPFLRNPQFVGREEDLTSLHTVLQKNGAVGIRPAGLIGLGGIGKTQLAVEYCHRYRDAYPGGVFWVNAAGEWLHAFADLGLFLDEDLFGKALDRQARAAAEYFAAHPDSLLVLDNVADPAQLRVPVTPDLTPAALPCRLIFTTRRRDLGESFWPVELSVLPEAPGLRLLLRHAARQPALDPSHPEHAAAVEIYRVLGGLPLALEIAGAHLGRLAGKPIAAYRDELLKRGALAVVDDRRGGVKDADLGTRHAAAVAATLAEQWNSLQSDDARLLLRVVSQLPEAEVIPAARLGLLAGVSDRDEGFFGAPLTLALDELHDAALVEKLSGETIRLHPLVRDFVARRTEAAETAAFRSECASNLLAAYQDFATLEAHCAHRGVDALEADLLVALTLADHDSNLQPLISRLLRMLQRESHALRGWDPARQPAHFAQQWLKRALMEDDRAMQEQARRGVVAAPRLTTNWLTAHPSPALERTLVGHGGRVLAVAVTPDGRRTISASQDGTLKVWNLVTGVAERTLIGHSNWVFAVAVTPDGRRVISGSGDDTLRMWDLATGAAKGTLIGSGGGVFAVAITPDGQRAISALLDGTLKVWDLVTSAVMHTLTGHGAWVDTVAVTPDGRRAISGSIDGTLKLWDLATGIAERTLTGHGDWVLSVAVTPDGRRAVSGSRDCTLKVWDLATGTAERTLTGHGSEVFSVAVTPDGRWAISASTDNTLRVWDLVTGAAERTLTGHGWGVLSVAVTPDGRRAISGAGDYTLKVWDLTMGTEERTLLTGHSSSVRAVAVTRDGRRAISASSDCTLKVWDLVTGAEERTLTKHGNNVDAVAVMPDGRRAISASSDRTLKVWNLVTGTEEQTFEVWDPATGVAERGLVMGKKATGVAEHTLIGHSAWVNAVAVTPDGGGSSRRRLTAHSRCGTWRRAL